MSWGINPWGVSPWGSTGPGSLLTGPAVINSRPFPTEITPLGVLSGGANNIILVSDAPDQQHFFRDYWLVYFENKVHVRQVTAYSSAREVTLSHDLPVSIPAAANVFLFAPDEWVPDLLHVSIRPSYDKMLNLSTLSLLHNYSQFSFDGLRPHVALGNPEAEHVGSVPSVSDFTYVNIDPSAPIGGLLGIDDSVKGLVFTAVSGTGKGQQRRIVRYDSATGRMYPDQDFTEIFDTTTRYELSQLPNTQYYNSDLPLTNTQIDVDAQYAGLHLSHDGGANYRNVLVVRQGGNHATSKPMQFQLLLHVESATLLAGQAGIVFGFQLGGANPHSIKFEIMHDGGGGAGDLVLRVHKAAATQDEVLVAGASPTAITNLTLSFFCSYDPVDDKLRVAVNSLFPIPGSPLISNLELPGFLTATYEGYVLPARPGGNLMFFGAGISGAPANVQYVRAAFLSEGRHVVRNGIVQGYVDGEVLSSFPVQTERDKNPLLWVRPWRPIAEGKIQPIDPLTITNDRTDEGVLVLQREELDGVIPNSGYNLVRYEPQLEDWRTRSFSMTLRAKVTEGEHLHWDVVGAGFGALLGAPGSHLHVQIAYLSDLGREKIGILLNTGSGFGLTLSDFLSADSEWSSDYKTYRIVYNEETGAADPYLHVYEDLNPTPILTLSGAALVASLPDETTSPLNLTGLYFGLMAQPFEVEMRHAFTRYFFNLIGYAPQLYYEMSVPTEPDTAPLPWTKVESVANTINYIKELDAQKQAYNGYMKLESQDSESYFYRSLADAALPAEHVLRQTDGFVVEFRVRIDGTSPPESVHEQTPEGRAGLWSGVGLTVDDGSDRIIFGFADGGSRGRFIFVAGGDPEDPTTSLAFADVQNWVEAAIRLPDTWYQHLHNIDWTGEHVYRLERSAAITSDRNARIRVFVDHSEDPVIDIPYLRGRFGAGSTQQISWGHLVDGRNAISYWRDVYYGVSAGFDIHTNQGLTIDQRREQMVEPIRPVLSSMSVHVEES